MSQQWFARIAGTICGPFSPKDIRRLAQRGDVTPETEVSMDQHKWVAATKLKGLTFPSPAAPTKPTKTAPSPDASSLHSRWREDHSGLSEISMPSLSTKMQKTAVTNKPTAEVPTKESPIEADIRETLAFPTEAIPGYEIREVIGRGAMGVVYRAKQIKFEREVAVKTLLVNLIDNPTAIARFDREAAVMGQLQHPNIVTAHDFGKVKNRVFLVMELLQGNNLQEEFAKRPQFDPQTALGIARQTASALATASQAGIVHRDIKPANLFLVDPPLGFKMPGGAKLVKVTDFGLAFLEQTGLQQRLTAEHQTVGTPRYMSPEQFTGDDITHLTDIYSLGCTLYHMLAGYTPFSDRFSKKEGMRLHLYRSANRPDRLRGKFPHISEDLDQLLQEMLEPNLSGRLQSYEELISRIDAILD